MQEKDNLRKKIKEYFKKHSLQERKQKNMTLIQKILDFLETQDFENIALYIAMKDEVNLKELEKKLIKRKKNILQAGKWPKKWVKNWVRYQFASKER